MCTRRRERLDRVLYNRARRGLTEPWQRQYWKRYCELQPGRIMAILRPGDRVRFCYKPGRKLIGA